MGSEASDLLSVFAHSLAGDGDSSPLECAQERGWVDAEGEPTVEGLDLSRALAEQSGTRSAFRMG